jgi:hypothetical protein
MLRGDRFVVFGGAGEITLIDRGNVHLAGWLQAPQHFAGRMVVRGAVRIGRSFEDDDRAAVLWCAGGACHVTRVFARRDTPVQEDEMWLFDDAVLPLCAE